MLSHPTITEGNRFHVGRGLSSIWRRLAGLVVEEPVAPDTLHRGEDLFVQAGHEAHGGIEPEGFGPTLRGPPPLDPAQVEVGENRPAGPRPAMCRRCVSCRATAPGGR